MLLQRRDIDKKRIVYVGHSFGAQWGAILSAVDRRMAGSVLMATAPSFAAINLEGNAPDVVELRNQVGMEAMKREEEAMRSLDAINYIRYASPIPLLFQFALYEPSFSVASMQALSDAARGPNEGPLVSQWTRTQRSGSADRSCPLDQQAAECSQRSCGGAATSLPLAII